jgi:hypothetical protein
VQRVGGPRARERHVEWRVGGPRARESWPSDSVFFTPSGGRLGCSSTAAVGLLHDNDPLGAMVPTRLLPYQWWTTSVFSIQA